jgi:excisionase family DNA binding protein
MTTQNANGTAEANAGGGDRPTRERAEMLDVNQVAGLLNCSPRHVYRLADMRRMPRPVKLGALVRWSRQTILGWVAQGCPNCRGG